MKQKLALACTLIHEPELLILDEPTTGIDPVSRRDFWAILAALLRETHLTAFVSTAYMDEASRFHRLALMYGGRIVAEGEPDDVRRLVKGQVVTVRATPQLEALARLAAALPQVEVQGACVRALVAEGDAASAAARVRDLLAGLPVDEVAVDEPDLEDVFVALMREAGLTHETGTVPRGTPRFGAPPAGGAAIQAAGLTRDFGAFRAVDAVTFEVRAGEIFGLLGANGAGKTTVIKMLTGILRPTAGSGRVAGVDMRRPARSIKARIGYMSQAFSLYQDLTVVENVRLYAGIYGLGAAETEARLAWILDVGDLGGHEDVPAGRLPMGMRQRLALGCALVHHPHALFLDEPTSGVDPVGRRRFWTILFGLARDEGVAILVTTHYMAEAEHCDRLALMFAGRLVADASPAELRRQVEAEAGRLLEVSVDRPGAALDRLVSEGFEAALHGTRLHLLSRDPDRDTARVAAALAAGGLVLRGVARRGLSMEDVFVSRVTGLERAAGGPR
jgi:ABC-2 type transport system ATP-binding protein